MDALDALVRARDRVAVFLDYDGTLTPIVARPELAVLTPEIRDAVRDLSGLCPVTVVSGRDRGNVEKLVAIENLGYVGSHGFDIVGPPGSGIRHEVARDALPSLDAAEKQLRDAVAGIPGALVERKRFGLAAHFRLVDEANHDAVQRAVDAVLAAHPDLRGAAGKKVLEARPRVDWDKGKAVLWLIERLNLGDALPMHLGDDETDETVFAALAGRGVGIHVGTEARPTRAEYQLRDTGEVFLFLTRLAALLRARR